MFEGLYFEFPKLLFLIFFYIACATLCKMRLPSIFFPHTAQFAGESIGVSRMLFFLKWTGIVMLIVAMMSPVKDRDLIIAPTQGYDIALVLDASRSMSAKGLDKKAPQKQRFDVVRDIVKAFVDKRVDDNLGIVVFGKYAFIASPLTYDGHIIKRIVDQLYIGMAGKFTAIDEALAQSVRLMKESPSKNKIAILLTDGHNTSGGKVSLDVALELAKKAKVRVYTIGIGVKEKVDALRLKRIADATGGKTFHASDASRLQQVYEEIDRLERSDIMRHSHTYKVYYFLYPLFIAMFSLLFYVYLRNKRGWA